MQIRIIDKPANVTDRNCCTVMALHIVTGISWNQATDALAKYGRRPNKGCRLDVWARAYKDFGGKLFVASRARNYFYTAGAHHGAQLPTAPTASTLGAFVKAHPTGRHIAIVTGHAVAVVDGVVMDTHHTSPRTRLSAWLTFPDTNKVSEVLINYGQRIIKLPTLDL